MLISIKPSTGMFFTGLYENNDGEIVEGRFDSSAHHNAEETLKGIVRQALVDRRKNGVRDGQHLHTIFRELQGEQGVNGATWDDLRDENKKAWQILAEKIFGE